MTDKSVITIATGKQLYIDMAANLARSFILWHKHSDITFYLATDLPLLIPNDIKAYTKIIELKPGELGNGFSPKMHLDKIVPNGRTLFIDSDCLIYGDMLPVFDRFEGHAVSVVGGFIQDGEWYGNIGEIQKKFGLNRVPKFNGGIYYIDKCETATNIYEKARELMAAYDEIGLTKFRNQIPDEPVMALALALNNQVPVIDDGTILSDRQACPGRFVTDVISGKAVLQNPPDPHPLHQNWYPFKTVSPLVVHFLGHYNLSYQYKKEAYRLKKHSEQQLNFITETNALISIEIKSRLLIFFKDSFRHLYHIFFGVRQVKKSERI